uniref:G-protein coupled receptor 54-like n=1 Tax=Sinocyclocheilus anshuiensis TaxID=1608454 RepID=A0A671L1A9_9TELE
MAESNSTTEVAELILCNNEANIYDCNQSDPMGSQSPIPLTDAWLVPVFFILIMFVGLVGNSLVIYVVVKNQQMKTVTNFYIVNLATTDILFLVCCVPFTATLYTLPSWIFGDFMCRLINYLQQVRLQTPAERVEAVRTRVSRMVVVMVLLFLLCWGPIQILILLQAFCSEDVSHSYTLYKLKIWAHCMSYSNSSINPVIYAFMGANFRKAFRSVFPLIFKRSARTSQPLPTYNREMNFLSS